MIVLRCNQIYAPDQLYSVQDLLNQIPCVSVAYCWDRERTDRMIDAKITQSCDDETVWENRVPTHIELKFADSIDEMMWALKHADMVEQGVAINYGTDVIHRSYPVADACVEDNDCIVLKKEN